LPGSWLYVLGGLFVAVVLFLPGGMAGAFSTALAWWRKRKT
jgi:urea transport system permease protein